MVFIGPSHRIIVMRHVDLCSGIGGFSLAFEEVGLSKTIMFCDTEKWCRDILAKHWPNVPITEDVKELANDPERLVPDCDILTSGYPCQPFSVAGKQRGTEDDRHIWPYLLQIVAQKRPAWCCFENVYGHVSMGLDQVLLDLETQGYASRTFIIPACGIDAPHRRDRVFVIAHTDSSHSRRRAIPRNFGGQRWEPAEARPASVQPCNGEQGTSDAQQGGEDVADTDSPRCEEQRRSQPAQEKHQAPQCRSGWLTEPPVGRVANGIPRRVDRLKGLGNAIVPQIAMRIGMTIKSVADQ